MSEKIRPASRLRRWVFRSGLASLLAVVIAITTLLIASRNLPFIARWSIRHFFPEFILELKSLEIAGPDRIEAKSIVLKDSKSGSLLLKLDEGAAVFQLSDLWHRQIGEVRLVNPSFLITPELLKAFTKEARKGEPIASKTWSIRRVVCDYGEVVLSKFEGGLPTITTRFACDFRDLTNGPGSDTLQKLTLWDTRVSTPDGNEFLNLDVAEIEASFKGITEERLLSAVRLQGGTLIVGAALRKLLDSGSPQTVKEKSWNVGALDINRLAVTIDDERPEISDITFALNTTMRNIALSKAPSELGQVEQLVEITGLEVLSPLDPFTKVLTLRSIALRFTLREILHNEIRELTIFEPTIYVGPDLFWYMDDAKKRLASEESSTTQPGWIIRTLRVDLGRLMIASGGRVQYGVPLNFHTTATDVSFDNLAALKMDAALEIPSQTYPFEDYQLEVTTEDGELRFSYPPEKNEDNLVGKINLPDIRWRQYQASAAWLTTTFDRHGINGKFGGVFYKGYVTGGFSFFFDPNSAWIGWIAGEKVDLQKLTSIISPKNFQMTGPMDFKLQMDAYAKNIQRISGSLNAPNPGTLKIRKLDDFLANIPPTWNSLKQGSTRIALEALRDFPYTDAGGSFWFVENQGILDLKLQGPAGSRNFEFVLHADDSKEGLWKQKRTN